MSPTDVRPETRVKTRPETRAEAPVGTMAVAHPGRVVHVVRRGPFSARLDARSIAVSWVMIVALFLLFCWTVSVGDFPIPIADVIRTLFGGGTKDSRFIVHDLRLPRALVGLMVGAAFGLSGAIFQSLARNPLASPDIIGVTQGASLAAVAVIVLGGSGDLLAGVAGFGVPLASLAGGLISAALVYVLSYRRGIVGYRLVLIGIGIGATMSGGLQYLLTRATIYEAARATVWLTGSLNGRGWEHVKPVSAGLIVLVPFALTLGRQLRLLEMGDDAAKGLGARVERSRIALIVCAVGLAALGTASAGPIAFVAFIAPVLARRVVGHGHVALVPSMLMGSVITLASDLIARRMLAPTELPVGIVTSIIGAPYLLWLLWRANSIGSGG
jgi:iron complex transport system permease protein